MSPVKQVANQRHAQKIQSRLAFREHWRIYSLWPSANLCVLCD
jgi:hypothetical protein